MAIEFDCPNCKARIRTPDDSAGKSARCPGCGGISVVPDAGPAPAAPIEASLAASNPFRDAPPSGSANPYATPGELYQPMWKAPPPADVVRQRLVAPAIGLLIFALAGLGFMALVAVGLTVDPDTFLKEVGNDPAQKAGATGFLVMYFLFGLVTRLVQLAGAVAMLRARNYSLAVAGAVCAILPCDVYCCLPCLPLGAWALIVLNGSGVKEAFQ